MTAARAGDPDRPSDSRDEWIQDAPIARFIRRVRAMRCGDASGESHEPPHPETAQRWLRTFAEVRPPTDLFRCAEVMARTGSRVDAVILLASAALCKPPDEAAHLAITLAEKDRPALTNGILHDFVCQRETHDIARFVGGLAASRYRTLAEDAWRLFADPSSGRTNLDKVLLYLDLRAVGCHDQARELLDVVLAAESAVLVKAEHADGGDDAGALSGPEELHDLIGSFRRLSPSEFIVETWIQDAVTDRKRGHLTAPAVQLACQLVKHRANESTQLIESIGRHWPANEIVEACRLVVDSPQAFALIVDSAAANPDTTELAELIDHWWHMMSLAKCRHALLAAIVRGGAGSTKARDVDFLNRLTVALSRQHATADCIQDIRVVAATEVTHHSGARIVELLSMIDDKGARQRAARTASERLAVHALRGDRKPADFVEYVVALHSRSGREWVNAAVVACRALTMSTAPATGPDAGRSAVISEVASGMFAADLERESQDLLERFLEDEHQIRPLDVVVVFRNLRTAIPDDDRMDLLRLTVGRWTSAANRSGVRLALQADGEQDLCAVLGG